MAHGMASGTLLGSSDFLVIDGRLFRCAYWSDTQAHRILVDADADRGGICRRPLFRAKGRTLHGVLCILPAALPGHSRWPPRLALDMGTGGTVHCSRLFGIG